MNTERRVLDPTQRAEPRRFGDTWIVTAGTGTLVCADKSEAWTKAIIHNSINGFDVMQGNRRAQ